MTNSVRRWAAGVGLAGGAAVAAAMLGGTIAHADNGTDEINGWTVTPTGGSPVGILAPATLSDPSDSLGLGTSPIAGGFNSVPDPSLGSIGASDELFSAPPDNLSIDDQWGPGFELSSTETGTDNSVFAFLVPAVGDKEVVDLVNITQGNSPPLFNPDATGPIDVGGLPLASPQAGALLNDLSDAIFTGNAADWTNAVTLFDDYLGIAPSAAADAVDLGSLLP